MFRELVGISVFWLALGMLFDGLNTIVIPARIGALAAEGARATTVGLVTFAGILAAMGVQLLAAEVSDRLRPGLGRLPFIAAAVAATLLALAAFAYAETFPAIVATYVAVLCAASAAQAAQQGLIPDRIAPRRRGLAAGAKNLMDLSGALLGFVLLGALFDGGSGAVAAALAIALVAALLLSAVLVRERAPAAGGSQGPGLPVVIASRFLFLLATFAIGRFFVLFVSARLGLAPERAAEDAGGLLGAITLATVLAAVPAGWAADRFGRGALIRAGAVTSAAGALLLIPASSSEAILGAGLLLALGSAAFVSANWAMTVDLVPARRGARDLALANVGTAGAAAVAGLFGPVVDLADRTAAGSGYIALFALAAGLFLASGLVARPALRSGGKAEPEASGPPR